MRKNGFSRWAIKAYTIGGRRFLKHIQDRGLRLEEVTPANLATYVRAQRRRYCRRNKRAPVDEGDWRSRQTSSVHLLLRLAQGAWPPLTPLESRVQALKERLHREQLRPDTVRQYLEHARLFLSYLERRCVPLEHVTPQDVEAFIFERLRIYRRKHGRSPRRFVRWRCEYTKAIHRLLREAQAQWPPASDDPELKRFQEHLMERGLNASYIQDYLSHTRQFLQYLNQRKMTPAAVRPDDVTAYFRVALGIYRQRKPNLPNSLRYWRMISRRAVYGLLRFAQGEWPPGSAPDPILSDFRAHLEEFRYCRIGIPSYMSAARQFVRYLKQQSVSVESARPAHVESFIQAKLDRFKERYRVLPRHPRQWRTRYAGAIHRLLRMVNPEWPPPEPPSNERERFQREVLDGYGRWLIDICGLSKETLLKNGEAARVFLQWLGDRAANRDSLARIGLAEIDQFLSWRMPGLRRATRHGVSQCLRSFLRYIHAEKLVAKDLVPLVSSPIMYKFDDIPRAFTEQQVKTLLDTAKRDKTPTGLRDHAILMLLSTYGLRAGEVVRLRLEDIDWRTERLRIQQSKSGVESFLPLLPPVGEALLNYLRRGRPQTEIREVFLRVRAPHGAFSRGGSLHTIINRRIKQAGIEVKGRHGAHAFRFTRATSLLNAAVPLKSIGDLLGHRSAESTHIYLRLDTDDLRAISIDLPGKGGTCRIGRPKTKR